ncbi:glutamyl-tRNA synthetase [Cunninghamella echinulata]|nr:glutamyl-tRNA synthetase [Cunninghamella echinulata]
MAYFATRITQRFNNNSFFIKKSIHHKTIQEFYCPYTTCRHDIHSVKPARVRFAPSPTGQLHLGGLRTALYNYLLAKKTKGQFILRIEDTDQTRFVPGAMESLLSSLSWAGIHPDEGPENGPYSPYIQSKRTAIYRQHANELLKSGHAYRCFCTPERLKEIRENRRGQMKLAYDKHCLHLSEEEINDLLSKKVPYTIRHNVPTTTTEMVEWNDHVYGKLQFKTTVLDDTILMKSDGYPTYHLANVIDDHIMKITHVLRGEEWISSTPKHILLYEAFGWTPPQFVHLPLLLNDNRTKLSKRTGDVHVEQYIEKGYFPEAINNFVALLGWHPNNDNNSMTEILDMDQLIQQFDLSHLHHSGAIVDPLKLSWINKQHLLKRASSDEGLNGLVDLVLPLIHERYSNTISPTYLRQVIITIKDRIRNIHDIPNLCGYYFSSPNYTTKDAMDLKKKLKKNAIQALLNEELKESYFQSSENIKQWIHELAEQHQVNGNHIMMVLRYIMTGTKVGAGVAETMHTLGYQPCIDRFDQFKNGY